MNTNNILRYFALFIGLLYAALMILMATGSYTVAGNNSDFSGFITRFSPGAIIIAASVYGFFRPKYGRYLFFLMAVVFTMYYKTYIDISLFMSFSFPLIVVSIILSLACVPGNRK